jgi:TPR repeat protein
LELPSAASFSTIKGLASLDAFPLESEPMKTRRRLLGLLLCPAFGVLVVAAWSHQRDDAGESAARSADFEMLDFIFSLIEQDLQAATKSVQYPDNRKELERLAKTYEAKAKAGDRQAKFQIGAMYLEGVGVAANIGNAANYFALAGGRDHPLALLAEGRFWLKCRVRNGRDDQARRAVIEALGKIGPAAEPAIPLLRIELGRSGWTSDAPAQALAHLGAPGVAILIEALGNNDVFIRRAALDGLARSGDAARPAVPAITAALEDDDPKIRELARRTLERLRSSEVRR